VNTRFKFGMIGLQISQGKGGNEKMEKRDARTGAGRQEADARTYMVFLDWDKR